MLSLLFKFVKKSKQKVLQKDIKCGILLLVSLICFKTLCKTKEKQINDV